jgi:hypothetical protein
MSLINDALKRAHESQGKTPGASPPLVPVAGPPRGGSGMMLPVSIVLLLVGGGILGWLALGHQSIKQINVPVKANVSVAPVAAVVVSPAPPPAPAPVVVAPPSNTVNPASPGSNVVEEYLPERWPKVQGIIYTPPQPMAIVNGKMAGVGDRLGHYQVKQITRTEVTFQGDDGSIKQLGVGE